jgi:hypothetical protein
MVKERRLTSLQEVNQVVIQERRVRPSHRTLGKKKWVELAPWRGVRSRKLVLARRRWHVDRSGGIRSNVSGWDDGP